MKNKVAHFHENEGGRQISEKHFSLFSSRYRNSFVMSNYRIAINSCFALRILVYLVRSNKFKMRAKINKITKGFIIKIFAMTNSM